ncbi:MAG: hypothetical protein ACREFY_11085 [Acetobacteraceae bacterium]
MRLLASCAAAIALLLLGGCQVPPPPPPPGPPLPLPPIRPPPPPARARESASWHFGSAPGACTADASGRTARLQITLRAGHTALFVLYARHGMKRSGPTAPGALRFTGTAGNWTADARIGPGSLAVAALRLDDQTVGRVALLLDGGTLIPIGAGSPVRRSAPIGSGTPVSAGTPAGTGTPIGTGTPAGPGTALPALLLPPAGAAGQQWFACARGLLF